MEADRTGPLVVYSVLFVQRFGVCWAHKEPRHPAQGRGALMEGDHTQTVTLIRTFGQLKTFRFI